MTDSILDFGFWIVNRLLRLALANPSAQFFFQAWYDTETRGRGALCVANI
jgi:hypothetical protein